MGKDKDVLARLKKDVAGMKTGKQKGEPLPDAKIDQPIGYNLPDDKTDSLSDRVEEIQNRIDRVLDQ